MTVAAWFNGKPETHSLAASRGLHYGDGVFRTLLRHEGRIVGVDAQIEKLRADAAAIGLDVPDATTLRDDLDRASGDVADAVLKLLLLRGGRSRGYRAQSDAVDRIALRYPPPAFPAACWREGIAAIRSPVIMAAQPLLAGIKHLNRLEQVLASRGWPDGIDEAILCDAQGAPVCGTRSNLFWIAGGVLFTPALTQCGVAGVMRAKVLALANALGIEARIGTQPWTAFAAADEAFICNSLIGLWPLRQIAARVLPAPGPVTSNLMQRLAHPTLRA